MRAAFPGYPRLAYLAGFLVKGDEGLGVIGHIVLGRDLRTFLDRANEGRGHELRYFEAKLNRGTAGLAEG